MSNENVSKELVRIANACLNKKADSDELYNYVKNILDTNDYILDEVLEDAMEYTNNFEIIKMLQEISEITSYCKSIVGKDKKTYRANLFAIPLVFVKEKGSIVEPIKNFEVELEKISKALRSTKVFDHECKIHIHNALFSPEQLMVLNYNYIYSFLNELTNLCFDKPFNILEAPEFEQEPCEEDSLHIRYLFGVRVFKEEAPQLSAEEEFAVLHDFNDQVNPILVKVLKGKNVSIIGVDELYPAIQVGLEFHTSVSRKISIEEHLSQTNVPAEYCAALIVIDMEDPEDSYIELTSTMSNEIIGITPIYPLKYQDPRELIGTITEELAEMGFEMDNVQIKADDAVYPIDFFLKFEEDIEIVSAVNNFLDNPDLDIEEK
jgi:hypothetical protein